MLLIIFAWALVNLDAVLRFLGKVLALFTPFLIGGGLGTFLILLADPGKALWFVLFLLVLQQVEGNLIYPKVVGKSVGLPGLLVLMAVTIGGEVFGILGMLIHDRIPSEHRAVRQMQRAWDYPKIAGYPDSGCACYSLKSQYPQIVMSPLFRKRGHFFFSDT